MADDYTVARRIRWLVLPKSHHSTKAHVDTIATVNALRTSISKLDHKMIECKGNIKEFHRHVGQLTTAMAAYSQKHDELLVNLFQAYAVVNDEEFREYIRGKRHSYEDGGTLTENTLMVNAENHFDMRVEAGTWKIVDKPNASWR